MAFSRWLEARPHFGIMASFSGFGVSFLVFLQDLSIIFGFIGAVFGLVAGYYTWRIKREHWKRLVREHVLKNSHNNH